MLGMGIKPWRENPDQRIRRREARRKKPVVGSTRGDK
jgi:hypothetical protein